MADLSKGLPLPSDYGDTQGIIRLSTTLLEHAQHQRFLLERDQYRNVLYYLGIQWITFDERLRTWIPQPTKRWAPKPVTNKLAATVRPIVSQLAGEEPNLYLAPLTDAAPDIATAQVGSRALDVLYRETGLRMLRPIMARWVTLTGNIFLISGYDTGQSQGMTTVQNYQCLACGQDAAPYDWEHGGPDGGYTAGACPLCGSTAGSVPSVDPFQQPRVTQYPRGRVYTELGSLFESYADLRAMYLKRSPWFQFVRTVTRSHLIDQFGPIAETVPAGGVGDTGTRIRWFLDSLAYATQSGTSVYAGRLGLEDDRVYVRDFWFEHPKFPDGLYAVIAGNQVLGPGPNGTGGPFPFHTVDSTTAPLAPDQPPPEREVRTPLRPVVHLGYEYVPGRLLFKTPCDDVAVKQTTRNKLEAMVELHMRRSSNTVWVVPQGSSITKVTGEEGIVLRYTPLAGGAPPQRQPGAEVPAAVWQYMEMIDKEIEDLMGCLTGDVQVPCLDGKTRTMADLAREYPHGGMWVYGFDRQAMRVVPAAITRAWQTKVEACVRVTFREGTFVDCTPDHPFLTWERGYVEAQHLRPDEALIPLQIRTRGIGYLAVLQPVDYCDEQVHRMVAHALLGLPRGREGTRLDVHHRDEQRANNLPENLEVLTRAEPLRRQPRQEAFGNRRPDVQAARSRRRWEETTPADRREQVTPMLLARRASWALIPSAERSRRMAAIRAARPNHRVASVTPLEGPRAVYDLQTSAHNFGTCAGVFVHNTYDVLRGETPRGVKAAMALQLLEQRGQQGLSELLVNWSLGHQEWAEQALGIFKEHGIDARFHTAMGDNGMWATQKFSAADLRGGVRVEVEAGLGRPRTQVGKRAVLQQAIALSLINPMDPQERHRALQILGMPELAKDMDMDLQAAARENDRWLDNAKLVAAGVMPQTWPTVRAAVDNNLVHLAVHRRFLITDRWDTLPPLVQQYALAHVQAHQMAVQAMMAGGPGNPRASIPGSARNQNAGGDGGELSELSEGQAAIGEGATRLGSGREMVGTMEDRPGGGD